MARSNLSDPAKRAAMNRPRKPVDAMEHDDETLTSGLEGLRRLHSKQQQPVSAVPRPGGLRKAASVAHIPPPSSVAAANVAPPPSDDGDDLRFRATDTVQTGLIASLDKDCRAYRAEIKTLQRKVAELEDEAAANPALTALRELTPKLNELRAKAVEWEKERSGLHASISRLRSAEPSAAEALAEAEAELKRYRTQAEAERNEMRGKLAQLSRDADAVRVEWATATEAADASQSELKAHHARLVAELRDELAQAVAARKQAEARAAAAEERAVEAASLPSGALGADAVALLRAQLAAAHEASRAAEAGRASAAKADAAARSKLEAAKAAAEAAAAKAREDALSARKRLDDVEGRERRVSGEKLGLRSDLNRANEAVKALRAKVASREAEMGAAGAASKHEADRDKRAAARAERKAEALEAANSELQAEVQRLRVVADECRADADAERARADAVGESHGAPSPKKEPKNASPAKGSHFARLVATQRENVALKEQLAQLVARLGEAGDDLTMLPEAAQPPAPAKTLWGAAGMEHSASVPSLRRDAGLLGDLGSGKPARARVSQPYISTGPGGRE